MVLSTMKSMLMNQQYFLNKVSVNRNIHETRFALIFFLPKKDVSEGLQQPNPVFSQEHWLSIC